MAISSPEKLEAAKEQVDRFVSYFDKTYRQLAYYAALPMILTPELLNFLRNKFLRGQVPWIAEADLLLSDLCRQAGYEQYIMRPDVRAYLLSAMKEEIGETAIQDAAQLLIQYVQHLAKLNPLLRREELQAQQWGAMLYLDDQREQAVKEIAGKMQGYTETDLATNLLNPSELAHLTGLVNSHNDQLEAYPELIDHAAQINQLIHARTSTEVEQVRQQTPSPQTKAAAGISLHIPDETLDHLVEQKKKEEETAASDAPQEVDPRKLLNVLNEMFNENELRDLCFDLSIDYENLAGSSKHAKARELILYFSRRNRLNLLITVLQEHRPNISPDTLLIDGSAQTPASTAPPSTSPVVNRKKLADGLQRYFDETELRTLCFDLGIDYEDLPPGRQKQKVFELVDYCERYMRINDLARAIQEARPAISLDEFGISQESIAQSIQFPDLKIPISVTKSAQTKADTLVTTQSFTSLIRLLSRPEVRTAVVSFQTDFEATSELIDLLHHYKLLHDSFQELENNSFLIINDQKRLPADETAWENLELNEPALQLKINDIKSIVQQRTDEDTSQWMQQLEKAGEAIKTGVEAYDYESVTSGTRLLYRILNRQPSRLNAQIVATASSLRLDNLQISMQTITKNLSEAGIEGFADLENGVSALSGLDTRLNDLVNEHNSWQELDDECRRIEASLEKGIEEISNAWFDIEPMTRAITGKQEAKWAEDLNKITSALDAALNDGMAVSVIRLFRRFRSQISRRFRQVDLELLSLCQDLQRIGESLDLLLRRFNK